MKRDRNNGPKVGEVIKSLRDQKKLSLRSLSDLSGLSVYAIRKIEHGENSPTVASLDKLASALEVPISNFFRQEIDQYSVFVRPEDSILLRSNGMTIEGIGHELTNQKLAPSKMIVAPGSGNIIEPISHSGEEFVFCLSGELEFFVGAEKYLLKPGDKLLFKANLPHCWQNLGNEPAEVILVLETSSGKNLPHKIH